MTDREEVFLGGSLLYRLPLRGQKVEMDALGENLEERNGVLNIFEVGGGLQTAAEVPLLASSGAVFLEDGCRGTLGDCLLYRMVVSFRLHANGRGIRRQGLLCAKCVRKW